MDTSNPVLSGLIRKRQEIAADLATVEVRFRRLTATMEAVDTTIRLFKPDIDFKAVKVRPSPRRHAAGAGGTSRVILTVLREAGSPLLIGEITRRVMQARDMDLTDKELTRTMGNRVGTSLRGLRSRGRLAADAEGDGLRWRVA